MGLSPWTNAKLEVLLISRVRVPSKSANTPYSKRGHPMHDRFSSADSLADISDEDLRLLQEPSAPLPAQQLDPWWEEFQYDLYDWDDPEFIAKNIGMLAYMPIRLTQGYFMMVHPSRYKEMTEHPDGLPMSWYAHVRRREGEIVGVYAMRKGRAGFDNMDCVLAHRQLLSIVDDSPTVVGEHLNRCGLDNRCQKEGDPVNLIIAGRDENGQNTVRFRADGLPTGVVRTGKEGNYRYHGQVCVRHSKTKVVTLRSEKWSEPGPAAKWYTDYLEQKWKRTMWAHRPDSVNPPFFPRRKTKARKDKQQAQVEALAATF